MGVPVSFDLEEKKVFLEVADFLNTIRSSDLRFHVFPKDS